MEERMRVRAMVAISALVILGSALMIVLAEGVNLWSMVIFLVIVALALVALYIAAKAMKDIRSGIPLKDERSQALAGRAAHVSFYVSMYLMLALAVVFIFLEDSDVVLPNSELLFILVAVMGSIHIAFATYYNKKGKKALG